MLFQGLLSLSYTQLIRQLFSIPPISEFASSHLDEMTKKISIRSFFNIPIITVATIIIVNLALPL